MKDITILLTEKQTVASTIKAKIKNVKSLKIFSCKYLPTIYIDEPESLPPFLLLSAFEFPPTIEANVLQMYAKIQ